MGVTMSDLSDAIQLLGEERVEEIRAGVSDLLQRVLANQFRYSRKGAESDAESRSRAA